MIPRHLHQTILNALADHPVVLLHGARGTGKSALAEAIAAEHVGAARIALGKPGVIARLQRDPDALFDPRACLTVIDDAHHAPDLVAGLVPRFGPGSDRGSGRLLLTASRDLTGALQAAGSPNIADYTLFPLSQQEIATRRHDFPERLFGAGWPAGDHRVERADLAARLVAGGLPGALACTAGRRRERWFGDHITNLLQRDLRELSPIDGLHELPGLLEQLATRSGALLNMSDIGRATGIALSTLRRYLALLEELLLFQPLPAWTPDHGPRCARSPRIHLLDSGLAAWLAGSLPPGRLARAPLPAPLFTGFVVQEVRRLLAVGRIPAVARHYTTASGRGIDLVLESADGRIAGIAVRARSALGADDFNGLRLLAKVAGDRFVRGVVVYPGEQCLPISDRLCALPVSALWD